MRAAPESNEHSAPCAFRDGLGDRIVTVDPAIGSSVQVLHLDRALWTAPGFEVALRERMARLVDFRHAAYPRAYRVDRSSPRELGLALVTEHVEGVRLADLLQVADEHDVVVETGAALSVIRQLLSATALFHEYAPDLANGLIAPERLVVTPRGRVIVTEQVLCGAVEQLHYRPEHLWRALRIVGWPEGGRVRFTPRSDVIAIGLVALAMLLGRPLTDDDVPARLPALIGELRERSSFGEARPLSAGLRGWLSSTLQLDAGRRAFHSPPESWVVFEKVVTADPAYLTTTSALETFSCRCAAVLMHRGAASRRVPGAGREYKPLAHATLADPPRPVVHLAAVSSPVECDEELRTEMLPPDGIDVDEDAAAAAAGIDWAAISDSPGAIATARDISSLFSEIDTARAPLGAPQLPDASVAFGTSPDFEDTDVEAAPADRLDVEPLLGRGLFRAHWPVTAAVANSSLPLRRIAVATALVVTLAGAGTAYARFARPAIVAASEMGTLFVETKPSGIQVLIDGIDRGRTPARISVAAGAHTLEVRGHGTPRVIPVTVEGGTEVSQYVEFAATPPAGQRVESAPPGATAALDGTARGTTPVNVPPARTTAAPEAAWGWLAVNADVPAQIRMGGKVVGTTATERIRMAAGRHEIELVNESREYRSRSVVQIVAGKVTTLTAERPPMGLVSLNATPWAEVWVGGRRLGETPLANVALPVGYYDVVFRHPELGEKRRAISVTAGKPIRLGVEMK